MIGSALLALVFLNTGASGAPRPPSKTDADLLALASRGAVVTVMSSLDGYSVRVDFPSGALRQQWRREHPYPFPFCGMGVEFELEPPDQSRPMTDDDLGILERVRKLDWVNLSGTRVTAAGVAQLKKRRPHVQIQWQEKPAP